CASSRRKKQESTQFEVKLTFWSTRALRVNVKTPRSSLISATTQNQVENWFARIQRDVIARGVFTSTKDLDKKLMRYIRQYNKRALPSKWKYSDPSRRIR
ncbi:hypothetical protein VSR34_38295, partial [Paraburkholderia sp. JHI2823]